MPQLVEYLFVFYVAIALFFTGFGMMLGGPPQAKSVLRYFFLRPLLWALRLTRGYALALLGLVWSAVLFYVLRPIGRLIVRTFRWLFTRERGWLRKWVWPS